jgi:hypothetical protein
MASKRALVADTLADPGPLHPILAFAREPEEVPA